MRAKGPRSIFAAPRSSTTYASWDASLRSASPAAPLAPSSRCSARAVAALCVLLIACLLLLTGASRVHGGLTGVLTLLQNGTSQGDDDRRVDAEVSHAEVAASDRAVGSLLADDDAVDGGGDSSSGGNSSSQDGGGERDSGEEEAGSSESKGSGGAVKGSAGDGVGGGAGGDRPVTSSRRREPSRVPVTPRARSARPSPRGSGLPASLADVLPADLRVSGAQPATLDNRALLQGIAHGLQAREGQKRRGGSPCAGFGATVPDRVEMMMRIGDAAAVAVRDRAVCVPLGTPVTLTLTARDKRGGRMCDGGDYFEVELTGESFKARPRTVDEGDGTYSVELVVPNEARFAGPYVTSITLLFTRYAGLTMSRSWKGDRYYKRPRHVRLVWAQSCDGGGSKGGGGGERRGSNQRLLARLESAHRGAAALEPTIDTVVARRLPSGAQREPRGSRTAAAAALSSPLPPEPVSCRNFSFTQYPLWGGYWVNTAALGGACEPPHCTGDAGRLGPEAGGWVYRHAHCYFHLFSVSEARQCLRGKWVAQFGDSNHQDTGRNLAHYVLESEPVVIKVRGVGWGGGAGRVSVTPWAVERSESCVAPQTLLPTTTPPSLPYHRARRCRVPTT